ncbi:MAG: hypothetical protein PHV37_02550 [Candidatus Gastranaerophilales bacterium]|nr:hypothetical protein [Candidatus Gastranaerophilales bacterium]
MSIDLDALIAKPQASITNNPAQPVVSQLPVAVSTINQNAVDKTPQKDIFTSSKAEEKKSSGVLDNVLKYSGVAALIATPVALVFNQKAAMKAINGVKDEMVSKIADSVSDIGTKMSGNIADSSAIKGLSAQITKLSEETSVIKNSVVKSGLIITAMEGFHILGNKMKTDNGRKITTEEEPVWGDLWVKGLDSKKELKPETIEKMKAEISRAVNGESQMTPIDKKDARLWSVSYETQFNNAGGQKDIAEQAPQAYTKQGVDTYAVAPLFDAAFKDGDKVGRTLTKNEDGSYSYRSKCYTKTDDNGKKYYPEIKLDLVYSGKMSDGANFRAFEGVVDGQKYLFLNDDKNFDYKDNELIGGTGKNATVYADLKGNPEKVRMGQFDNLVYEALAVAKEGKMKHADGTSIDAPNKMVAHEAWQSGGLIAKMRLVSIAEEDDGARSKDTAEYLRKMADNTAVPIHNIGEGYQGRVWDSKTIKSYYNTIYGGYAADIVNNAFIEEKDLDGKEIFGTPNQRLGFTSNFMNPAALSVALASKIGAVSEGYTDEISEKNLAGKDLTTLLKLRQSNKGLVSFPNGVDKAPEASTREVLYGVPNDKTKKGNIHGINAKLAELLGPDVDTKIRPYLNDVSDDVSKIDPAKFAEDKVHNKKMFIALLKDAAQNNDKPSPLLAGAPNFFGTFNIDDINENTPMFTMASRMDSQKGFDTCVVAYSKLLDTISSVNKMGKGEKLDVPVMIISGGAEGTPYDTDVKNLIEAEQKKHPEARILWTRNRMSAGGLQLMNMTTTNTTASDFEPFGISDLKGMYNGSHDILTEVGGMKASGNISRKAYPAEFDENGRLTNPDTANSITVKDYEYMCTAGDKKEEVRDRDAEKLKEAMATEMFLNPEDRTRMDLNALGLDVSWDKGAVKNYMDIMQVK